MAAGCAPVRETRPTTGKTRTTQDTIHKDTRHQRQAHKTQHNTAQNVKTQTRYDNKTHTRHRTTDVRTTPHCHGISPQPTWCKRKVCSCLDASSPPPPAPPMILSRRSISPPRASLSSTVSASRASMVRMDGWT